MDQEQIEKQLKWLDDERREDKQTIAALKKRIDELEEIVEKTGGSIRDVESEVTKVGVRVTKLDTFDESLEVHRKEVKKELDAIEKRIRGRETNVQESIHENATEFRKAIVDLEKSLKDIPPLQKGIDQNKAEFPRLTTQIDELKKEIREVSEKIQANAHTVQVMDDDISSNKKRFADVQGELAALRKRQDEQRVQHELIVESNKKTENRITELVVSEDQRRETQREFIDKITRSQMDVEKAFKEWTTRFDDIEQRAETLTEALQTYSEIERSLKNAQGEFEEITEQINRRIHEITEMQRLGEERFRQEWTTFKSDDQKRWVNYTLTQEEQSKEVSRRLDRLNDRTTTLEELHQELQDTVQQSGEQLENLIQGLLGSYREWLTTTERFSESL